MLGRVVTFCGTAKLSPTAAASFHAPTSNVWEFQFLHILTNSCYFPFLKIKKKFILAFLKMKGYIILDNSYLKKKNPCSGHRKAFCQLVSAWPPVKRLLSVSLPGGLSVPLPSRQLPLSPGQPSTGRRPVVPSMLLSSFKPFGTCSPSGSHQGDHESYNVGFLQTNPTKLSFASLALITKFDRGLRGLIFV